MNAIKRFFKWFLGGAKNKKKERPCNYEYANYGGEGAEVYTSPGSGDIRRFVIYRDNCKTLARCSDCAYMVCHVNWWCKSKEASDYRGTHIPGICKCPFWKPDEEYIRKRFNEGDEAYVNKRVMEESNKNKKHT